MSAADRLIFALFICILFTFIYIFPPLKHPFFPTSILIILVYVALALPFSSCEPDPGLPSTDSIITVDTLPYNYIYKSYVINNWMCNVSGYHYTPYQLEIKQDTINFNQVLVSNFANISGQVVGVLSSDNSADSIIITVPTQYFSYPSSSNPNIYDTLFVNGNLFVYPDSIIIQQHTKINSFYGDVCIGFGNPQ